MNIINSTKTNIQSCPQNGRYVSTAWGPFEQEKLCSYASGSWWKRCLICALAATKANHILGHISNGTISWLGVVVISFYMALEEDTSRKPSTNEMSKKLRESNGEPQDGPGHEQREMLQEPGLLSLLTRRPKGLVTAVPLSQGEVVNNNERKRGNGHNFQQGNFFYIQ